MEILTIVIRNRNNRANCLKRFGMSIFRDTKTQLDRALSNLIQF